MNLFDLGLKFSGFPITKAERFLEQIQAIKEVDYDDYLRNKKKEIVKYHLTNNSFYRSFAENASPTDWNSVPIMTKSDLQQPLEMLLSSGFSKKNIYIDKTSGASGTPFYFSKDKFCHALTWAIIKDRFSWYDIDFNSSKQARFYGIVLDGSGFSKERLKDIVSHRTRFNVFDLSDASFEQWIAVFKKKKLEYMNGYTSSMVQFAKYLKRKEVKLKDICPSLHVCIVTSEMLFDDDKKLMETQFGVPVVNEYGASELDLIAFQNPEGLWQVNSESLFVEVLDEDNNVLPFGTEGRLVITSLYNKSQPFIRYDIGDVGVLSGQSTLKLPILEKLIGRTNDIVKLPSGKRAAGLTFYYITKSIIEKDGKVKEFVIEQHSLSDFKVIYVSSVRLSGEMETLIKKEMTNYLESGLNITFEHRDEIKRSKSGKLKQFSSLIRNQ